MKNIFKKIGIFFLLLVTACDLDGDLENPNQVSVTGADVDLIMNNIQLNFADFFHSAAGSVDPLVRMQAMTGGYRYQTAFNPSSLNNLWDLAYRNVLISNQIMQPLAVSKGLTTHVAVGKILEAYTYLTLVDVFGDVPQAEALQAASGNFNPAPTAGSGVYAYAIQLLTEARTELAKTGSDAGGALGRDIFYGGSRANWTALANSLELKAWINISMIPSRAAEANAKIAGFVNLSTGAAVANLVDTEAENFRYKYGTATVPAGSRHPWYDQYYGISPGTADGYLNNYYLHEVFGKWDSADPANVDKVVQDPRWRYYFYRQVGSIDVNESKFDPNAIFCGAPPPHYTAWGGGVFCVFEPGFFGRDHGDGSGTPPDGAAMTCAGAYPAGGKIDLNPITNLKFNVSAKRGDGTNGAGIQPIFMSWFTDFTRAELMARAGQPAIAKTILATAIGNSITQIKNIVTAGGQTLTVGVTTSTTIYQAAVATLYDAASIKMDVIGKEYWISLFGNGIEAYNMYRRTSAPRNLQPTVQVSTDPYFRSMVYPAIYANLNSSATQKNAAVTNKVFWDNNPDNLN